MSLLLSVTTVCRKRSRYSPGNVSVGSDVSDEPAEKGLLRSAQSPALGSPVEKLEPWTRLHWLVLRHQRVGEPVEKQSVNNPIYTWKTRPVAPVCGSHQTAKYSNCQAALPMHHGQGCRAKIEQRVGLCLLQCCNMRLLMTKLWMVVAPCLTAKPHPDCFLLTEPSVYTMRSCGLLLFFVVVFLQ